MRTRIPEIDVIIAVALWLHAHDWILTAVSIPKGQGIDTAEDRRRLKEKLCDAGVPVRSIRFRPKGPDIEATSDGRRWRIECKGLGKGKVQTLRNNFDRSLASAVSYYDSDEGLRLGLALPAGDAYLGLIVDKIPQALRRALNLWILLYDPSAGTIESIEPTQTPPESAKYRDAIQL